MQRHVVKLGSSNPIDCDANSASSSKFHSPRIDVSNFKPNQLANVGMITAELIEGDQVLVTINAVTQVQNRSGTLMREIYNPLEQ